MSGRAEATTVIGHWVGLSILCGAWVVLLTRGLDGAAVMFLTGAWVVFHRGKDRASRMLSGCLLTAALAVGMIDWVWGWGAAAAMILAGALLAGRSERCHLRDALAISVVIIVLMMAFAVLRGARPVLLAPAAVSAAGWWMILRWGDRGESLLRRMTIPVFGTALAWLVLVLSGQPGGAAERRAWRLVRNASDSPTPEAKEASLAAATRTYPWSPALWAAIGREEQCAGAVDGAFRSFEQGYALRPGARNPCLAGLSETSRLLGRWRILGDLIAGRLVDPAAVGSTGRLYVAVELWRSGRPHDALAVLQTSQDLTPAEVEITGWIHHAMGHDSMATAILVRVVTGGTPSGETIYRLMAAYRRLGRNQEADDLLSEWGARFPAHLDLVRQRGGTPVEPCGRRFGDGGLLLGNAVRLLGWEATPVRAAPGDTLRIRTCWVATKPLEDMRMILHLDAGSPGQYRLNHDHAPLGGALPTSRWPVGEVVTDSIRVPIPRDAPTGTYRLFTGLWVPGDETSRLWPDRSRADLIPSGEKRIPLGTVRVDRV